MTPGSPEEYAVAQAVTNLRLPLDEQGLETALEVSRDPRLQTLAQAIPGLLSTPQGLEYARALATIQPTTPDQARAAAAAQAERARTAAHVETGGTGAPTSGAPGRGPKDEFDEVLEYVNSRKGSPIFGR